MNGSGSDFKPGQLNIVSNENYLSQLNDLNLSPQKEDSADE